MVIENELHRDHRPGPQALERGFDIIELLAEHRQGLPFGGLQQATGISKPILSRLLKSLVARDFLIHDQSTRLYRRSAGLLRLSRGLAPPPHSRRAMSLAGADPLRKLFETIDQSVMLTHYDGSRLESVMSHVAEEGLAVWPSGSQKSNLADILWGWIVLHDQGMEEADLPRHKDCPGLYNQRQDAFQQLDLGRPAVIIKQAHCWRIVAGVRCTMETPQGIVPEGRLVGVVGSFANPALLSDSDKRGIVDKVANAAAEISQSLGYTPPQTLLAGVS